MKGDKGLLIVLGGIIGILTVWIMAVIGCFSNKKQATKRDFSRGIVTTVAPIDTTIKKYVDHRLHSVEVFDLSGMLTFSQYWERGELRYEKKWKDGKVTWFAHYNWGMKRYEYTCDKNGKQIKVVRYDKNGKELNSDMQQEEGCVR